MRVALDSTQVITENLWADETDVEKNVLKKIWWRINTISAFMIKCNKNTTLHDNQHILIFTKTNNHSLQIEADWIHFNLK